MGNKRNVFVSNLEHACSTHDTCTAYYFIYGATHVMCAAASISTPTESFMKLNIALRSPDYKLVCCKPKSNLFQPSCIQQFMSRCKARAQGWNEHRRVEHTYRCDLHILAKLGERELADFGAPCGLRSEVARYR